MIPTSSSPEQKLSPPCHPVIILTLQECHHSFLSMLFPKAWKRNDILFECRVPKNSKERWESLPQDQCKDIEEHRMGKTRDLFKKIRDTKGIFHAKTCSKRNVLKTDAASSFHTAGEGSTLFFFFFFFILPILFYF